MAERLPVGATKNNGRLPPLAPILTSETASTGVDFVNSPLNSSEPDSNGSNGFAFTHGASSISNLGRGSSDVVKNGSKVTDADGTNEPEWVEQYEPGVYITLGSLPGGARELRRVRFRYSRNASLVYEFPIITSRGFLDITLPTCEIKQISSLLVLQTYNVFLQLCAIFSFQKLLLIFILHNAVESGSVRDKQSNGGRRTARGYTRSTISALSINPPPVSAMMKHLINIRCDLKIIYELLI